MKEAITTQLAELQNTSFSELNKKYKELFGKAETASHKMYLFRRIAYRLQELESNGISNEAKKRLKELIEKYDPINNKEFRPEPTITRASSCDRRLPIPGTVITKKYKGTNYIVKVLENNFEYDEKIYNSLSAIAKEITGSHWNGYFFFNL